MALSLQPLIPDQSQGIARCNLGFLPGHEQLFLLWSMFGPSRHVSCHPCPLLSHSSSMSHQRNFWHGASDEGGFGTWVGPPMQISQQIRFCERLVTQMCQILNSRAQEPKHDRHNQPWTFWTGSHICSSRCLLPLGGRGVFWCTHSIHGVQYWMSAPLKIIAISLEMSSAVCHTFNPHQSHTTKKRRFSLTYTLL